MLIPSGIVVTEFSTCNEASQLEILSMKRSTDSGDEISDNVSVDKFSLVIFSLLVTVVAFAVTLLVTGFLLLFLGIFKLLITVVAFAVTLLVTGFLLLFLGIFRQEDVCKPDRALRQEENN